MKMGKTKILLVQITNKNYGDPVIADNARYLLKKAIPLWKRHRYDILDYSIATEDAEQVKYADAVVFAGGGIIKFGKEKFYLWISQIISEAEKHNVPVFLNAVGVEDYDEADERCIMLKEALNRSCVKGVSVRDDIGMLSDNYMTDTDVKPAAVYDPAIWSARTYKGRITSKKTEYIGLGIAREKLFSDYGYEQINRQRLLDFWRDTALTLEKRGYKWKIFTNGLDSDETFANDVLAYIGHGEKIAQPKNALDLVNTINSFDSIIACRMHANIIAYSLKIPSIGLVWNEKLRHWGEKIGYPGRFISADRMTAETVADALETAREEGCKGPKRSDRHTTLRELKRFVRRYGRRTGRECEDIDYANRVFATALGGLEFKYKNTNTLEALRASVKNGYKCLEADVRLTKDGKLVCVNGWSKDTFKKLGLEFDDSCKDGLMYDDFMKLRYHDMFCTVDFEQFLCEIAKHEGLKIIIDIGRPKSELTEEMLKKLTSALKACPLSEGSFIIRLQREKDVKLFKSIGYKCKIAYYVPPVSDENGDMTEKYSKIVNFCRSQKIKLVSMPDKALNDEILKLLKENSINICLMSYTKAGDIISALRSGVYMVGSHYYCLDYIRRLTNI